MNTPAYPITVFWSAEDSAWETDNSSSCLSCRAGQRSSNSDNSAPAILTER